MRIDFQYAPQPPEPERGRAQSNEAANRSSATATPPAAQDQAQFSGAHARVAALAAQAAQLPEMREERVEALRQAVESGRYQLDAQKVAGAMLEWTAPRSAA